MKWVAGVILLSNAAIIGGAALFGWNPLSVVLLFVVDLVFCSLRFTVERLFAARPRGDVKPPTYPWVPITGMIHEVIYEGLLEKRGAIALTHRLPKVYPRNIPYALELWVTVAALCFLFGISWFAIDPVPGAVDVTIGVIVVLFIIKHVSVISNWDDRERYARASAPTIRQSRELIWPFGVAVLALVFVGPQPPSNSIVVAASIPVAAKLVVDFRDAGIGPSRIIRDPESTTEDAVLDLPVGEPTHRFETNQRAIRLATLAYAALHTFLPGAGVIAAFGFIALLYNSLLLGVLGFLVTVLVVMGIDYLAMWLAYRNVEYHVYEDALVAYDMYLEEPQWVVPFREITAVETQSKLGISRILPGVEPPKVIERTDTDPIHCPYLDRPAEVKQALPRYQSR